MNRLLADAAALIDVASVSHHEQDIADLVETRLRSLGDGRLEVHRIANNVLARSNFGRPSRLVLAGHLDTVPPNGNDKARVVGDTLWGLGASDMKGGLSVMLDLAASLCQSAGAGARQPAFDVTFVFYSCEEVDRSYSGLLEIEAASPGLLAGDAASLFLPLVHGAVAQIDPGEGAVDRLSDDLDRLVGHHQDGLQAGQQRLTLVRNVSVGVHLRPSRDLGGRLRAH